VRRVDGVLEAFPDTSEPTYQKWYKLNTGVDEDLQKDPRESPDGRSYICIQSDLPVCFVAGSGQWTAAPDDDLTASLSKEIPTQV
jgi:hypothetical protein